MITYKVSFVVTGRRDVGSIQSLNHVPEQGDTVLLGSDVYEVVSVVELMPPKENTVYLHAVCQPQPQEAVPLFYPGQKLHQRRISSSFHLIRSQ